MNNTMINLLMTSFFTRKSINPFYIIQVVAFLCHPYIPKHYYNDKCFYHKNTLLFLCLFRRLTEVWTVCCCVAVTLAVSLVMTWTHTPCCSYNWYHQEWLLSVRKRYVDPCLCSTFMCTLINRAHTRLQALAREEG